MSQNQCPRCKSTDIKKSSAVYEQGASNISTGTVGVGAGSGGLGVGAGSTRGTQVTQAALKNAPPKLNPLIGCAWVGNFVVVMVGAFAFHMVHGVGSFFFWLLLAFVAAIVGAVVATVQVKPKSDLAQAHYTKQWYCMACGLVFRKDT